LDLTVDTALDELHLRTLYPADAPLLVEATRRERAPAVWGPRPDGPYTLADAIAALDRWTAARGQLSYGLLRAGELLGAFGLMLDGPDSAELAYWVRPEQRRQGLAGRGIVAMTDWAHRAGLTRLWLEIDPDNEASRRVALRGGYELEQRLARHCRLWTDEDEERDTWRDCAIWSHTRSRPSTACATWCGR
jgi:RimJ/RimL family protein N-acetyltransferase